jgi:serine/threonine-protein kinase
MNVLRRTYHFLAGLVQFSLYAVLFFVLMVAAGYGVALQFFGGKEVAAPDLTGVLLSEALVRLQPRHISLQLERRQPHIQVPRDHVISQYPRPGAIIKAGTPLRVVVSEGQPLVAVPDLRGSNKIEAGIRLRKLGLNVGTIATIPRTGVAGGIVLTTDPPAGTGVTVGVTVNLLLAAGEGAPIRQMPNLIGLTREEAREVLGSYGLAIAQEREQDTADVPVGHIHAQSPPPGETIDPATRIEITLQPPRPEVSPTPGTDADTRTDTDTSPVSVDTRRWPDAFLREPTPAPPSGGGSSAESPPPAVDLNFGRDH